MAFPMTNFFMRFLPSIPVKKSPVCLVFHRCQGSSLLCSQCMLISRKKTSKITTNSCWNMSPEPCLFYRLKSLASQIISELLIWYEQREERKLLNIYDEDRSKAILRQREMCCGSGGSVLGGCGHPVLKEHRSKRIWMIIMRRSFTHMQWGLSMRLISLGVMGFCWKFAVHLLFLFAAWPVFNETVTFFISRIPWPTHPMTFKVTYVYCFCHLLLKIQQWFSQ